MRKNQELVIIDTFSRWTELIPLKTVTAEETAVGLLNYVTAYCTPERMTSDRGTQFVNEVIGSLQTQLETRVLTTVAGNHQENGLAENRIRFVGRLLAAYHAEPTDYRIMCMLTRRVLNSREHATLGLAPADLQFGIAHRLNRQLFAEEPRTGNYRYVQ